MLRKTAAALVAVLVIFVSPAIATGDFKEAAIRELLEITKTEALARQAMMLQWPHTWSLLRKAYPGISEDLAPVFEREMLIALDEKMPVSMDGVVKIYGKYFTADEILELLAWYKTNLGLKTIKVMPLLLQDSAKWGEKWGGEIVAPRATERIMERLQEEGYQP